MSINIFLSYPTPHLQTQKAFLEKISAYVTGHGVHPCTMGVSNYDMDAPLAGIRRLMVGCCGLLAVGFKRSFCASLNVRRGADLPNTSATEHTEVWLTSPYVQIEPAMAYQLGLPILILRERGVLAEGVLERGVTGLYCPEFDCSDETSLDLSNFKSVVDQWVGRVRSVYDARGAPSSLF